MKQLTFAFDCQLNDDEDYIKEGTVVQVATDVIRQHEGFMAVTITEGYSYNGDPIQFVPFTDYFTHKSFKELQ